MLVDVPPASSCSKDPVPESPLAVMDKSSMPPAIPVSVPQMPTGMAMSVSPVIMAKSGTRKVSPVLALRIKIGTDTPV